MPSRLPLLIWLGGVLSAGSVGLYLVVSGQAVDGAWLITAALAGGGVSAIFAIRGHRLWRAAKARMDGGSMNSGRSSSQGEQDGR